MTSLTPINGNYSSSRGKDGVSEVAGFVFVAYIDTGGTGDYLPCILSSPNSKKPQTERLREEIK